MKPKAKSRTSAQITGDHFLKLGLAEMREFVEYVSEKPDGKDALTILLQRITEARNEKVGRPMTLEEEKYLPRGQTG